MKIRTSKILALGLVIALVASLFTVAAPVSARAGPEIGAIVVSNGASNPVSSLVARNAATPGLSLARSSIAFTNPATIRGSPVSLVSAGASGFTSIRGSPSAALQTRTAIGLTTGPPSWSNYAISSTRITMNERSSSVATDIATTMIAMVLTFLILIALFLAAATLRSARQNAHATGHGLLWRAGSLFHLKFPITSVNSKFAGDKRDSRTEIARFSQATLISGASALS